MSRASRMALIAAVTLAGMSVIEVDTEEVSEDILDDRPFQPPASLLAKALTRYTVPCCASYDWEVDPAVISRPVGDTMPTQAGVRSNARHRTMTTIANGADPQVPGTCKEKRSSALVRRCESGDFHDCTTGSWSLGPLKAKPQSRLVSTVDNLHPPGGS